MHTEAQCTPATMSMQHSTLLPKTATVSNEFIVKCRCFDKVECCFNIVAVFGNNVASLATSLPKMATMLLPVSATMSNEISSFRQSLNKLNMFNLFRIYEAIVRLVAFDSVASRSSLVWTGLNSAAITTNSSCTGNGELV